jgi:hypothetical protein
VGRHLANDVRRLYSYWNDSNEAIIHTHDLVIEADSLNVQHRASSGRPKRRPTTVDLSYPIVPEVCTNVLKSNQVELDANVDTTVSS